MSESDEQRAIVAWFRAEYPEFAKCLRVSQSEGQKGGGRKAAIGWSKRVAMGVVKGESDIAILLPRGGFGSLLVEHKADGSKHTTSEDQIDYINHHNSASVGNCAIVTRGVDMAKAAIRQYMNNDKTDDIGERDACIQTIAQPNGS